MEMTLATTGVICVLFGLVGFIGQLISTVDFRLAQKLGLQEADAETDPLHRRLELNTAKWDLVVSWVLPMAGALMLLDHPWWPFVALVAGGISVDTAGRECAKILGLREHGVKTGGRSETRLYVGFMTLMLLIGVWCIAYGLVTLI
jgi:hypothetical protein